MSNVIRLLSVVLECELYMWKFQGIAVALGTYVSFRKVDQAELITLNN